MGWHRGGILRVIRTMSTRRHLLQYFDVRLVRRSLGGGECFLVISVFATLLAVPVLSQPQTREVPIERKHFRQVLEYFGPPHEIQVKTMLSGARARLEPGGMIFMTDAKLEMFDEKGTLQAVAVTPECVFDTNTRFLCSTGHVKVVRLELQDSTEGDGFSWQQTNSLMILSNNVLTVAHNLSRPE